MENAIILAGGLGKRMNSEKPKVLLEVLGKPMLSWVTDACVNAGIERICVVKGYGAEMIDDFVAGRFETAYQPERLGTGHAVMCAEDFLRANPESHTFIACGDAPFTDFKTIRAAYEYHKLSDSAVTVVTAEIAEPKGYGRIIRTKTGISGIVEEKDCTPQQRAICEISSGCYWFKTSALLEALPKLTRNNAQGEYYLTDTIEILLKSGKKATAFKTDNADAVLGANDRKGLLKLNEIARQRIIEKHLTAGVEFITTDGIIISPDVKIGRGTKVLPSTILMGKTEIGEDCEIGPNARFTNVKIGDDNHLQFIYGHDCEVKNHVTAGPYVHLRPDTVISDHVKIGNYVEVKNSNVGEGTKLPHLTYIGDSDIGSGVNMGCGCITVNYDGKKKHRTVIGDNAFVGCNTNLVAPVTVQANTYIGAGSTITKEVPENALGIARARQKNIEGWAEKYRNEGK